MDTVLLQQFEEYLKIRGVASQRGSNQKSDATGKRKKRSVPSIADTLSNEEVLFYHFVDFNKVLHKSLSFITE